MMQSFRKCPTVMRGHEGSWGSASHPKTLKHVKEQGIEPLTTGKTSKIN